MHLYVGNLAFLNRRASQGCLEYKVFGVGIFVLPLFLLAMMYETNLHHLQESWEKEKEEIQNKVFNQLTSDFLAREE